MSISFFKDKNSNDLFDAAIWAFKDISFAEGGPARRASDPVADVGNTSSDYGENNQIREFAEVLEQLYLDGIGGIRVTNLTTGTPPGSPTRWDRYIVATGTGDWAGQDNNLATFNGLAWHFITPAQGNRVYNEDDNKLYEYSGSAWVEVDLVPPHDLAGGDHNADTLANLNTKISDATLIDTGDSRLSDARDWIASVVSQVEAEAGVATDERKWTAERINQAIQALSPTATGSFVIYTISGAQAISTGTINVTRLDFNSQVQDKLSEFNASNYQFEPTVGSGETRFFRVSANIAFNNACNDGVFFFLQFRRGTKGVTPPASQGASGAISQFVHTSASASAGLYINVTGIVGLGEDETIYLACSHNAGSNQTINANEWDARFEITEVL